MNFNCPHCQQALETDDHHAGRDIQCPACGRYIKVPGTRAISPPVVPDKPVERSTPSYSTTSHSSLQNVRVVDIKMPFGSMVVFLIKWALASIPAMIILGLIYLLVVGMIMGGCMSAMMGMK